MTAPQSDRLTNGPTMGTPHSGFSSSLPSVTPEASTCEVPECNKVFQTRAEYTRHMRYHSRREKCPRCDRGFGTVTHLNRHINDMHQRANIYYCPVTDGKYWRMSGKGKFFSRKENLKRLLRDTHRRTNES
ncbi:hypothetical protein NA56DRAFT_369822 [Hyaloscypha hepaticicola]|uniref:C2H2-type domain-containing protein n=1 Tax=Hyaloscypha hepaticicola TaxID=2082293 RepID=A0A2J6PKX2_9HELO|nr:hypothetical protein NA56DRAFT_369822 [Hyaloscypha hepaticicola]